jgi:flagellar motility protein MotE (MotC chaperone)
LDGASYEKKTGMSICDELKDEDAMTAYVEDAAGISGCKLDGTGCDERALKFLDKWKDKHPQDIHNELDRLVSLMEGNMNHELKDWVKERRNSLKQIADEHDEIKTDDEIKTEL